MKTYEKLDDLINDMDDFVSFFKKEVLRVDRSEKNKKQIFAAAAKALDAAIDACEEAQSVGDSE